MPNSILASLPTALLPILALPILSRGATPAKPIFEAAYEDEIQDIVFHVDAKADIAKPALITFGRRAIWFSQSGEQIAVLSQKDEWCRGMSSDVEAMGPTSLHILDDDSVVAGCEEEYGRRLTYGVFRRGQPVKAFPRGMGRLEPAGSYFREGAAAVYDHNGRMVWLAESNAGTLTRISVGPHGEVARARLHPDPADPKLASWSVELFGAKGVLEWSARLTGTVDLEKVYYDGGPAVARNAGLQLFHGRRGALFVVRDETPSYQFDKTVSTVYAFDPKGKPLWEPVPRQGPYWRAVLLYPGDDTLVTLDDSQRVVALKLQTGEWAAPVDLRAILAAKGLLGAAAPARLSLGFSEDGRRAFVAALGSGTRPRPVLVFGVSEVAHPEGWELQLTTISEVTRDWEQPVCRFLDGGGFFLVRTSRLVRVYRLP